MGGTHFDLLRQFTGTYISNQSHHPSGWATPAMTVVASTVQQSHKTHPNRLSWNTPLREELGPNSMRLVPIPRGDMAQIQHF